ncbi:serine/threonine protein kinase [Catenulispora sp. GP43]|uniref:serine/threonine-protein kinase n=1 Tax=Catenulispora sp. GP43 TaxID=3156263 RepID=UPI0035145821
MDTDVADPVGPGDPREIGQFTIIGVLGAGGMGEVFLGTREGRYVAVKRVKPRLVSGERFNREVAILHRVPFGVAPSLLASDSTAPEPWFATEYVPGLTVEDAVRAFGPLAADALWLLLAETAAHLQAVHEAGIVHRDLKPGNIMMVRDGVKLIDFGIALAGDQSRLTRSGSSSGTRGFTAPEQESGDRDVAAPADVYSLAATLVYAASVRLPGAQPDIAPIRALDAALTGIVERCLAADPDARPTAADLVAAARAHADSVSPSWPAAVTERIAKRRTFASTPVSVIDTVLPPEPDVDTEPEPGPLQETAAGTKPERRRPRFLIPLAAVTAFCAVVAGALALLASSHRGGAAHASSPTSGIGIVPIAGTQSSSAGSGGTTPRPPTPTTPGATTPSAGTSSNTATGPGSGTTTPQGPGSSSKNGGGGSSSAGRPVTTGTAPSTPPSSPPAPKPGPSPTASSIPGINSADDPARVSNSEVDVNYVANDAECSAWLDTDGSGNLAGVLNTSLYQSCVAEVIRSDGLTLTFSASQYAEKTSFIADQGYTMQVCVWHADEKSNEKCSPLYAMSGTTPVQR